MQHVKPQHSHLTCGLVGEVSRSSDYNISVEKADEPLNIVDNVVHHYRTMPEADQTAQMAKQ